MQQKRAHAGLKTARVGWGSSGEKGRSGRRAAEESDPSAAASSSAMMHKPGCLRWTGATRRRAPNTARLANRRAQRTDAQKQRKKQNAAHAGVMADKPTDTQIREDHNYIVFAAQIRQDHNYIVMAAQIRQDHNYIVMAAQIRQDHNYIVMAAQIREDRPEEHSPPRPTAAEQPAHHMRKKKDRLEKNARYAYRAMARVAV